MPTWNYEAVHLTGRVEWFDDPARLEAIVRDLSAFHEQDRPQPWSIDDAPRAYIDALLRGSFALPPLCFRSAARWVAGLAQRGLAVETAPMSQGTPFANVLFAARKVV